MGRVFVVQADLTKLVVDDVVVPCDAALNVHHGFHDLFRADLQPGTLRNPKYRRPVGCEQVRPGLWRYPDAQRPRVWLIDSAAGYLAEPSREALVGRIRESLELIAGPGRRIAMTLMGIKQGGFAEQYAEVIRETLAALDGVCRTRDVDVVLSLRDRPDYAAVQHLRRRAHRVPPEWRATAEAARRLADLAAQGRLVLFIGAGASVGAGFDDWQGLLDRLADDVGLDRGSLEDFAKLDPRDQALLIATAPGAKGDISRRIAEVFQGRRYPLTQALLASLRVREALTTNYDLLYETAYDFGGSPSDRLRVLPRQRYLTGAPWLMKLHGDALVPDSIVLSRDDYIRFDAESAPMGSVLQAAMLTSHLLFVGYSVSDENVVRLARQVVVFRRSMGEGEPGSDAVGSVLVPSYQPAKALLWQGVLDYVPLPGGPPGEDRDQWWRERVWAVEVFLDLLGMYACQDAPYLMVDRYADLLDEPELRLKRALIALAEELRHAPAIAAPLVRVLEQFGGRVDR